MLRRPWFWLLFAAVSLVATLAAVRYFGAAFPLVDLDLRMDRAQALAEAKRLAGERGVGPPRFRQAAKFELEDEVQSFVELEAGGREVFREMLASGVYQPYTWRVRHFREGEVREAELRFTPAGEPYGFSEQLAEDAPGPALDAMRARALAEAGARRWQVDLTAWDLVEQGSETRPGGRVDHTLVYQLRERALGKDGHYRLRLRVAGDRLTTLQRFVEVPEAFTRRYEEMRSDNNAIAAASGVAMVVLYIIGGCLGGLVILLRHRQVIWRQALGWGAFVGLLQLLAGLNSWPQIWFGYDTAVSIGTFAGRQLLAQVAGFVLMSLLLGISFMAAESLTRQAFPRQLQLWRLWRPEVAASPAVLGRTVGAYLLVGVFFAYEVGLYFVTTRQLGWWSPADALYDPNVLASYFPWLSAIAQSLQAGFWEECLFRAVPLAGAALLGERFGGRRGRTWALVAAFVLQALVFGAGHANYPTEPAWARVVELIVPSFMFAGLYLTFGLLPGIVLHFAFDVVWFALPLFVASSSGIWVSQLMVVLLTLIPLGVVLVARWRIGAWREVDAGERNAAWVPPPLPPAVDEPPAPGPAVLAPVVWRSVLGLGALGLGAWLWLGGPTNTAPPLAMDREQALAVARAALAEHGFAPAPPWRELPTVEADTGDAGRFVWQTGGEAAYRQLLGQYLPPPRWSVRVARFEGDVAERAEEWQVLIRDPQTVRVIHTLPAARQGASLDEAAARALASAAVRERYGIDPSTLDVVSSTPQKRPARVDWSFEWKDPDPARYPLTSGEARIGVEVAGDEVVQTYRTVHIPEEWERNDRSRQSTSAIVRVLSIALLSLVFLAGIGMAVVSVARRELAWRPTVVAAVALLAVGGIGGWNGWPKVVAQLQTAQPWQLQVVLAVTFLALALVLRGLGIALLVGQVMRWAAERSAGADRRAVWVGGALGALLAGLTTVARHLSPALEPPSADFSAAGYRLPWLGHALEPLAALVSLAAGALFLVLACDAASRGFTRRRGGVVGLLVALAFAVVGARGFDGWVGFLLGGSLVAVGLVAGWLLVLRASPAAVPLAVATWLGLALAREGAHAAYPGAQLGAALGVVLILATGIWWTRALAAPRTRGASR